ncbi:MAG: YcxB family protein [Oscillospiraceae bacterium]|jgi:hypothetical protein|nr:YcxB family protein [Oscillospiraceae bacterium]MCI8878967.1 YcxB family protein [Oscillospiraceae bacterium]
MRFVFQMSGYGDPALDEEAVQLLEQRLEKKSRQVMPGMWSLTDRLNGHASGDSGRENRKMRYRTYGGVLLALGVLALAAGLREPRTPSLIWAGGFAAFCGGMEFLSARKKRPHIPPASCRNEAIRLLDRLRGVDWSAPANRMELCFTGDGLTIAGAEEEKTVPYGEIKSIFETERLWLLIYGEEQAILLKKEDLQEGDPSEFLPYIREKCAK